MKLQPVEKVLARLWYLDMHQLYTLKREASHQMVYTNPHQQKLQAEINERGQHTLKVLEKLQELKELVEGGPK